MISKWFKKNILRKDIIRGSTVVSPIVDLPTYEELLVEAEKKALEGVLSQKIVQDMFDYLTEPGAYEDSVKYVENHNCYSEWELKEMYPKARVVHWGEHRRIDSDYLLGSISKVIAKRILKGYVDE